MPRLLLVSLVSLSLGSSVAVASERRSGASSNRLEIELPVDIQFGTVVIPAQKYRLRVNSRGISFIHPTTMLSAGTISTVPKPLKTGVAKPIVSLDIKDNNYTISLKKGDFIYTATGIKSTIIRKTKSVTLASNRSPLKNVALPQAEAVPRGKLIKEALTRRYLRDVRHCTDQAQKSRWKTDDPKFEKCVCPMADRWRLAKGDKEITVHEAMSKGKTGITLGVSAEGRVSSCRVWVGATPPQ